ncbi:hypothetical protein J6590_054561 [Homalodisca vitripennis]|nr:hypothetical protein J6590_054561 [Homalodisca vitripennis]
MKSFKAFCGTKSWIFSRSCTSAIFPYISCPTSRFAVPRTALKQHEFPCPRLLSPQPFAAISPGRGGRVRGGEGGKMTIEFIYEANAGLPLAPN